MRDPIRQNVFCSLLDPEDIQDVKLRVLFIGNSHTFFNDSIPVVLRNFTDDAAFEMVTIGGCTLNRHWHEGPARSVLNDSRFKWNTVVIQENGWFPSKDPDDSFEYASKFNQEITALGAKPVWFMTHAYHKFAEKHKNAEGYLDSEEMYMNARALADRVHKELEMQIAPVGEAWWAYQNSTTEKADTRDLYNDDGVHATPIGTYLTACVFYTVLLDRDPIGLPTLSFEHAGQMQKLAGDTVSKEKDRN